VIEHVEELGSEFGSNPLVDLGHFVQRNVPLFKPGPPKNRRLEFPGTNARHSRSTNDFAQQSIARRRRISNTNAREKIGVRGIRERGGNSLVAREDRPRRSLRLLLNSQDNAGQSQILKPDRCARDFFYLPILKLVGSDPKRISARGQFVGGASISTTHQTKLLTSS
jgi:hypothetical protein